MVKPDPERAELTKQWRIFLQGIDEDFENIPGTWLGMFAPQALSKNRTEPATDERRPDKGNKS
jgi:hypothetical protein